MFRNRDCVCVICGEETGSPDYDYCYDCFYEMKDKKDEISHLCKKELYNLFNSTLKSTNKNNFVENMTLLHAIKELSLDKFDDYEMYEDLESSIFNFDESVNKDYRLNYETKYRCDDGHYVRSKAEQIIDNWLYYHNFTHAYEKQLTIENINYIPDFYIPKFDLYIEYWGMENEEYIQKRKAKEQAYKKAKIKLLGIEESDLKNLDDLLEKHLKYIDA